MKKNRKKIRWLIPAPIILSFAVIFILLGAKAPSSKKDKPNVIIINVDDLGYGDTGAYGATHVKTPAIDQLAKEGCMFTDAHSASAVCSPSRYALMTGEYPCRIGLYNPLFLKSTLAIDTAQVTIGKVMKSAGYSTAAFGKWHLGFTTDSVMDWNKELKPGPLELGFDYYFGVPILNSHPPFVYVENHNVVGYMPDDPFVYGKQAETRCFQEKFNLDAIGGAKAAHALYDDRAVGTTLKEKAVGWIKKHKDEPFFVYLATTNIHHPFTPASRFIGTSNAGRYGDFIHELDWIVSEVMKTLDEEGLADNTLLILTSDNGAMLNQGGQDAWKEGHKMNGDLLGFKFDAWEGGHRIPFIARWPGKIKADSKSDELYCNSDLVATMAALVGYKLKDDEAIDSYNLLPALLGNPKRTIRDCMVIAPSKKQNISIRKGKWMYISDQGGGGFSAKEVGAHGFGGPAAFPFTGEVNSDIEDGKIKADAPPAQLYDLEADPYEKNNIYNDHPKVVAELKSLLEDVLDSEKTRRK